MSDQDLELQRLRRAFASLGGEKAGGCPAADRLWAAVHGELPPDEVRPLVSHLLDCGACAEAWRLAREVDARAADASEVAASPAPPRTWWGGWGALAAGTAAVALAAFLLLQHPGERPGFREGLPNEIRSLVPESRPLSRRGALLRRSPGPEGASYRVQVATERLEPIAQARGLTVPEYLVPPDKLASLPAGTPLLWQVGGGGARWRPRDVSSRFVSRLE